MKVLFKLKNQNGMTLIEVIVGVAVIGIMSVMVLTVFTTGMKLAANAGDNSLVTGKAMANTNNVIVIKDVETSGTEQATIYFAGDKSVTTKKVSGNLEIEDENSEYNETTIKVFVPVKVSP